MNNGNILPKIIYGNQKRVLQPAGQYLLMRAGILNGEYSGEELKKKIDDVDIRDVSSAMGRRDIELSRVLISEMCEESQIISVKDFKPNEKRLKRFVNNMTIDKLLQRP